MLDKAPVVVMFASVFQDKQVRVRVSLTHDGTQQLWWEWLAEQFWFCMFCQAPQSMQYKKNSKIKKNSVITKTVLFIYYLIYWQLI